MGVIDEGLASIDDGIRANPQLIGSIVEPIRRF
jgi:hypothetical protein